MLSRAGSVRLSILEGAVSRGPSGNAARKEAGRGVAGFEGRIWRPARSREASQTLAGEAVRGAPRREARVLQVRTLPKPVARAEPVVFHHGREERVHQPLHQSRQHAGRWKWRRLLSRPVAEDEATRTVCKTPNALLVLGQSDRTVRHPRPASKPDLVELNRLSMTR